MQRLLSGRNILAMFWAMDPSVCGGPAPKLPRHPAASFFAIAPPRNARWLGSAPCTELRCYAGLFRGPKNGLEMRYRSGPVNSFLNLGPKSGLVVGSEKRTQNWPSKTIEKRDQPYGTNIAQYCKRGALRTANVRSKALQTSLNAVIELYAWKKLVAAAPRANCCRSGEPKFRNSLPKIRPRTWPLVRSRKKQDLDCRRYDPPMKR